MVIFFNQKIIQLEKIEYTGTVFVLDHKYPEQLINHSIKKLEKFGIKKEDIKITDAPDDPKRIAKAIEDAGGKAYIVQSDIGTRIEG